MADTPPFAVTPPLQHEDASCATCAYRARPEDGLRLQCRRFPPQAAAGSIFPEVDPASWCGEHVHEDDVEAEVPRLAPAHLQSNPS